MKTLLLFVQSFFLLFAIPVWAQLSKTPDGFLDMSWGTPAEEAKSKLLARPGVRLKRNSEHGVLYSGGNFAGHSVVTWHLGFADGKLENGQASLGGNPKDILPKVRKELSDKYGTPKRSRGDGTCEWFFPASATHPIAESINVFINEKFNEVVVRYSVEVDKNNQPPKVRPRDGDK